MICPNCGYKTVTEEETFKKSKRIENNAKNSAKRNCDVQVSTALERLQLFQRGRAGFYIGNARRVL
jgi:uncharacterized Zn finger protein (UPF0148 family)